MTKLLVIPDPKPGQKAHSIACPDCERTWPSIRHVERYRLHWRVVHGAPK